MSSSWNEPGSSSFSTRSRAVSLPLACCFSSASRVRVGRLLAQLLELGELLLVGLGGLLPRHEGGGLLRSARLGAREGAVVRRAEVVERRPRGRRRSGRRRWARARRRGCGGSGSGGRDRLGLGRRSRLRRLGSGAGAGSTARARRDRLRLAACGAAVRARARREPASEHEARPEAGATGEAGRGAAGGSARGGGRLGRLRLGAPARRLAARARGSGSGSGSGAGSGSGSPPRP